MTINRTVLTGRLVADPELHQLPGGESVCEIRLAVDGMGQDLDAGFIRVKQFGKGGEAAARVLSRGWAVSVDGRLRHRRWETDGAKRQTYEVVGIIGFLGAPRDAAEASTQPRDGADITL